MEEVFRAHMRAVLPGEIGGRKVSAELSTLFIYE